jgi:hypothetical protein
VKPLNLAQEPLATTSTKVTIKPGAEVRNAQQAATVLSQEERLAGKRAARENYGTMAGGGGSGGGGDVVDDVANGGQRPSNSAALIEETITVSSDSRRPSKVVISQALQARDRDEHDEGSPLL